MRKLALLAMVLGVIAFVASAGRILMVRDVRKADAILVLDGETDRRPALGIELLRQGYAPRVLLDASLDGYVYHLTPAQIAEECIHALPPGIAGSVSVCGVSALSTIAEVGQARHCLDAGGRAQRAGSHFGIPYASCAEYLSPRLSQPLDRRGRSC
jgi:hypothetical protein